MFAPVYRRLSRSMGGRRNLAALATLMIIVVMVILPLALVTVSLLQEASRVYARIQAGELSFGRYFQQIYDALPAWAVGLVLSERPHSAFGLGRGRLGLLETPRVNPGFKKSRQKWVALATCCQ